MKNKIFPRALALLLSVAVLAVGLPLAGLTASADGADKEYVIWEADPTRFAENIGDVLTGSAGESKATLAYDDGYYYSIAARRTYGWNRFPTLNNNQYRDLIPSGQGKTTALLDAENVMSALNTAAADGSSAVYYSLDIRTTSSATVGYDFNLAATNNQGSTYNENAVITNLFTVSGKELKNNKGNWQTCTGKVTMPDKNWYTGMVYIKDGTDGGFEIRNLRFTVKESDRASINTALESTGWTFDDLVAFDDVASYSPNKITVNAVSLENGGTVSVSATTVKVGDTVTVTVTRDAGYELIGVTAQAAGGASVELTPTGNDGEYTFIAPSGNVTVSATFNYVGNEYAVTSGKTGEGTVTVSATAARQSDEITVTAVGAHGYKTKSVSVTDSNGEVVALTKTGFNYTFSMPAGSVNVAVEFEAITEAERKYVIWEADPASMEDLELASYTADELPSGTIKGYTNYEAYKMSGENDGDPAYYSFTLYGNGDGANTLLKTPLAKTDSGLEWLDNSDVLYAVDQYMSFSYEARSDGTVQTNIYANLSNGYNKICGLQGFKSETEGDWKSYTKSGLEFTDWWNGAVNFSHYVGGGIGEDGVTVDVRKMKIEVSNYDAELINYALSGTDFTFESITAFDRQSSYTENKYNKVTTDFVGATADVTYDGLDGNCKAVSGSKVSFTVADKRGFNLVGVAAKTANGTEVPLTNTNGTYSFTMPESEVTVVVTLTSDGSAVFDEYVIWEADPTRGYPDADIGDEIQNGGDLKTVLAREKGEYFYSTTSGNNSWGSSYLSTGLNNNSYNIPWIGDNAVLKAIDEYLKVSCDVRSSVTDTTFFIYANTGDGNYYDDVKVKLLSGKAGTEWQTVSGTVDFSDMGMSWYGGNIRIQAYGETPTLDVRNFRITVSEDDRAAINTALSGTGYTFDDITAFDPSSNYSGNYLEYNRISLSNAKLDTNGITASNTVGLQNEKKAKAGAVVSIDVNSTRRQKIAGIKVTVEDGTNVKTNGLSFTMPEQAVEVVTFVTDDISHRTTYAVDTGNNTQQINFVSTFKHSLEHIVAGYDIVATLPDGSVKNYHIYGTKVFSEFNGTTALSVSGNNDGYAFVAGISGVPTDIGAIEFEVTPFVYDTYKNGIVKGETEKVYYYNGTEETGMIKSDASRTTSNYTVSFETDHPGVVGMDAEYTLVVNGNPQISIVNADDYTEKPTLSGKILTVPYVVRNSETVLKLNVGGEIFRIDFPKFTDNATFSDDFDTLDESKWSAYKSDSIQNVTIENGALVMKTDATNEASSLSTSGKFSQSYGSFSARIKVPKAGNGNAAFWLYSIPNKAGLISSDGLTVPTEPYVPNLDNTDWNSAGEIDVIERSAKWADDEYATSLHWNGHTEGNSTSKASAQENCGINIADGEYHTFSTVWTETSITWYIDGKLLFQYTPGKTMNEDDCAVLKNDDGMGVAPDSGEMMLILQNSLTGQDSSWLGKYNAGDYADGNGYMYVDSVTVYGLR